MRSITQCQKAHPRPTQGFSGALHSERVNSSMAFFLRNTWMGIPHTYDSLGGQRKSNYNKNGLNAYCSNYIAKLESLKNI